MPRIEYSPSDPRPIERLLCPRCGTPMDLSRVEPDEPGFDLRIFECPKCQHSESFVVKSAGAPHGAGELRHASSGRLMED